MVTDKLAGRTGTALGWAFAALLGYAGLHPELKIFDGFSLVRLLLMLVFVASCAVYASWFRTAQRSPSPDALSFSRAAAPAWPLLAALVLAPPISSDPLLYLHYGSMALGGENPYTALPSVFSSPFSSSVVWQMTCAYGPLALAVYALAALAQNALLGVLLLKLAWLGSHLLGVHACFQLGGADRTLRTRAFLFNPVLLFGFVVDAHVDALVAGLCLCGCLALARDWARLALVAFLAATLTKGVALPALALWFAWALSRRRYALALSGVGFLVGVAVLLSLTLFPTLSAWRALLGAVPNTGRSVQHVLVLLNPSWGFDVIRVYSWLARGAFAIIAAAVWVRAARANPYSAFALARDFAFLFFLACLFVVAFVPWWYGAIVIAVVLWSPLAAPLRRATLVYGYCAACTLSVGSGLSRAGLVSALLAIVPASILLVYTAWRGEARS